MVAVSNWYLTNKGIIIVVGVELARHLVNTNDNPLHGLFVAMH